MIIPTLRFLIFLASLTCWGVARRGRKGLIGTTLTTPFHLLDLGVWIWCLMLLFEQFPDIPHGIIEYGRYLSTLFILGAGISVLGARRPGAQAWTWFVVVPMFLVLGWPALLSWGNESIPERLELTTPAFLGLLLVIVMAVGNYLTTRWEFPLLCTALSLVLFLLGRTLWIPSSGIWPMGIQLASDLIGMLALFLAMLGTTAPHPTTSHGLECFWQDFRNHFGIVWGYRVMERLNLEAQRLDWPFRFEIDRIVVNHVQADAPPALNPADLPKNIPGEVRFSLEWLFRRFVSDEWRDARLGPEWSSVSSTPPSGGTAQ